MLCVATAAAWEKRLRGEKKLRGKKKETNKKKKPKATTSSRSTHRARTIKGHLADEVQIHTALTANHSVALDRTKENFKLLREKCARLSKTGMKDNRGRKYLQEHQLQG